MLCPKCGKELVKMYLPGFMYCPQNTRLEKYGEPYNRKAKLVTLDGSGCGALYETSVTDWEYWNELIPEKYKPWNIPEKTW